MDEIFDENGRLLIDLYHGTSTLFLDSIIANGFGAVNPINGEFWNWSYLGLANALHIKPDKLFTLIILILLLALVYGFAAKINGGLPDHSHGLV